MASGSNSNALMVKAPSYHFGPAMPQGGGVPLLVLPDLVLQGAWQMALDRWLLDAVAACGSAVVLRFYGWPWPVLSLGRHQRRYPAHWDALARAGALELVRRPSGGTAVLHWGGLTYALVVPRRLLPGGSSTDVYRFCCRWLQQGAAACGMPLRFGDGAASLGCSHCFSQATAADLVDKDTGHKRIGNAQLRGTHAVLQHGEILLRPAAALWQQLFGSAAPPAAPFRAHGSSHKSNADPVAVSLLKQQLLAALTRQLGLTRRHRWQPAAEDWAAMAPQTGNLAPVYRRRPARSKTAARQPAGEGKAARAEVPGLDVLARDQPPDGAW